MEIHSASVTGPWPHDERFIVGFQYEVTNKPSGKRMKLDEVALYSVANGQVVREEFSIPWATRRRTSSRPHLRITSRLTQRTWN